MLQSLSLLVGTPLFVGGLGPMEIGVIVVLIVLLFGADKLPKLARGAGQAMGEFEKAKEELNKEVEEVKEVKEEVDEVKEDVKGDVEDVKGVTKDIEKNVKDVTNDIEETTEKLKGDKSGGSSLDDTIDNR